MATSNINRCFDEKGIDSLIEKLGGRFLSFKFFFSLNGKIRRTISEESFKKIQRELGFTDGDCGFDETTKYLLSHTLHSTTEKYNPPFSLRVYKSSGLNGNLYDIEIF